jgi:hypothetical protein
MFLRLLYLIALIGVVGSDTTTSSHDEDQKMGGEGFGNVVMLAVIIGALVIGGLLVLAILGLTGQFENTIVDPPV